MIDSWGIPVTIDDEMGVLLESVAANDAILMWPVSVLGNRISDGVDLHITLNWGKWDGLDEELRVAIATLLEGKATSLPPIRDWAATEFKGREKTFKVFVLPQIKDVVLELRSLVSPVFPDNFGNGYTPHISMSESLWDEVVRGKLTPVEAGLSIGDLELRLGDKTLQVFP